MNHNECGVWDKSMMQHIQSNENALNSQLINVRFRYIKNNKLSAPQLYNIDA